MCSPKGLRFKLHHGATALSAISIANATSSRVIGSMSPGYLASTANRVRALACSISGRTEIPSGFHALTFVHDLAAAVRLPINEAELFAKRFKSTIGHNQNVRRHVDITHRAP